MDVFLDGPHMHVKVIWKGDITRIFFETKREYNDKDRKKVKKNYKAKKFLIYGIGPAK